MAERPELPASVKIWPLMGFAAMRNNHGGAWRLWVLAHALDQAGSGWVAARELREALSALDVERTTAWRWLDDALALGLLEAVDDRYYLVGHARACVLLDCGHIGKRWCLIETPKLYKKGWRAWVWAAYIAQVQFKGNPLSREKLEELTGVQARMQLEHEKTAKVKRRPNYGKWEKGSMSLAEVRAYQPSAFEMTDYKDGRKKKFARRLPDTRSAPLGVASGRRGRSGKINRILNAHANEVVNNVARLDVWPVRIFQPSLKAAKAAYVYLVARGARILPTELWVKTTHGKSCTMHAAAFGPELGALSVA